MGATYQANTDPTKWESRLGRRLGVRRTYWGPGQVAAAVRTARCDVRVHRIPWLSFKLPYGWKSMASGRGDPWTRHLASRLARLHGPVWLAFHHEPEGDGDVAEWKAMQERLAPIVRATARNVAFSVILTGLHQVNGDPRYSFGSIWPDTKVDIAGFDPYNWFGTVKPDGLVNMDPVDMKQAYFDSISKWARSRGVAWAVAETGYTDVAHRDDPLWLPRTFEELEADHGIALTYFDTTLNSESSWTWVLGGSGKEAAFADVLARSARLHERPVAPGD